MKDIQKAADSIVPYINEHGQWAEKQLKIGGDRYKPMYRALAAFWCDTPQPIKDLEVSTIEEVENILVAAHPFFVDSINQDRELFEHLYGFFKDAWEH